MFIVHGPSFIVRDRLRNRNPPSSPLKLRGEQRGVIDFHPHVDDEPVIKGHLPNASMISRQKAGKSAGYLEVIRFPSLTTS